MIIGSDYIKKELWWFLKVVVAVALLEYLVLSALKVTLLISVVLQVVIGIIFMSATIRVGYRIWYIYHHHQFLHDDHDSQQSVNGT